MNHGHAGSKHEARRSGLGHSSPEPNVPRDRGLWHPWVICFDFYRYLVNILLPTGSLAVLAVKSGPGRYKEGVISTSVRIMGHPDSTEILSPSIVIKIC